MQILSQARSLRQESYQRGYRQMCSPLSLSTACGTLWLSISSRESLHSMICIFSEKEGIELVCEDVAAHTCHELQRRRRMMVPRSCVGPCRTRLTTGSKVDYRR